MVRKTQNNSMTTLSPSCQELTKIKDSLQFNFRFTIKNLFNGTSTVRDQLKVVQYLKLLGKERFSKHFFLCKLQSDTCIIVKIFIS